MRLILAFQVFFAILFGRALPVKALPAPVEPEDKRAERERLARELADLKRTIEDLKKEVTDAKLARDAFERERESARKEKGQAEARLAETTAELEKLRAKLEEARAARERAEGKLGAARDEGALALLAWLQRSGRLIDFVMEDVDGYSDEQVGAAVREIHRGCRKVVEEAFGVEPILDGAESERVKVQAGFDPVSIQLTGNVRGDPPFSGTLMHKGWRSTKVHVPVSETLDAHVLAPAEVEL